MTEYKELYLPFYFTWRDMTEELSNDELGLIIRALLDNFFERRVPDELPDKMRIIYKFMLDSAVRTHKGQRELSEKRRESANKRWAKKDGTESEENASECKSMQRYAINENGKENGKENGNVNVNINGNGNKRCAKEKEKTRYGDFDAEEAFQRALERSYGKREGK